MEFLKEETVMTTREKVIDVFSRFIGIKVLGLLVILMMMNTAYLVKKIKCVESNEKKCIQIMKKVFTYEF